MQQVNSPVALVWRSLPESEMRAVFVVVADVFREQTFQVAFVNCTDDPSDLGSESAALDNSSATTFAKLSA
jgi:hypothetical protein